MRILIFLFCFLFTTLSYADVYVIYKTDTKEIASIQDDDSAVLENGYSKKIINGKTTADYPLEHSPNYYKYSDGKFIVNVSKISDEENKKDLDGEIAKEEALVAKKIRNMAIKALKDDGVELKYLKEE